MAKPVLGELHGGLSAVLSDPKLYLVVIFGILGVVFQQFGLATGRLAPTVASGSVASPIVAVVLGAALLQETLARPDWRAVIAVCALGLTMVAAVVIAMTPHPDTSGPAAAGLAVAERGDSQAVYPR